MASSEPSISRLPEEDSSDNEVSQIDIDSQISTSIRSSKSAKKSDRVSIVDSMQRIPWARERDLLLPSVCSALVI